MEKRCGTCRLWAVHFYESLPLPARGTGCCADAVMDLPASWSSNTPMGQHDGEDCIAWERHVKPGERFANFIAVAEESDL